ncbi:FAD-dependent monooxygenase [Alkalilacustris brevis]|uniref:FAD-dependent monooxygenase n=1 Tax=Alkalilacustris brevis TaxID=2026338 RepID=UPI001EE3E6BD|nr:FAD-dependent monooxygenase [Alkalilacustris brevis]
MDLGRMFSDQPVAVLGGGVAGLAVATALARRGAAVQLFEQASEITEVGAGLQISPNGVAVLDALGLGPDLAAAGTRAEAVQLRDGRSGAGVLRLDLLHAGHPRGYYFLHRADLIGVLERAARDAGVEMRLGRRCTDFDHHADGVTLHFEGGRTVETPLAIGADGLHSRLRRALNPSAEPFFTGQVAWRAVIPAEAGAPPVAEVFMGPGRHLVSYPLRGGRQRNIVAVEERSAWADEGWNQRDNPLVMRHAFAGFGGPVQDWLAQADEVWLWGLFRHPVADRWHGAHCAILGDAAHPTLPFLAQGANMALEDAWVLAAALAEAPDMDSALAAYQALRAPRTRRIVAAANRNARAYHLSGLPRLLAHAALRLGGRLAPRAPLRRFNWLYTHDVTAAPTTR